MSNTDLTHTSGNFSRANLSSGTSSFRADLIGQKSELDRQASRISHFFKPSLSEATSYKGLGFVPKHKRLHRIYNQSIGLFFVLLVLPLLLMISAILLVAQGRPIFYRGERVGQNGTSFGILKFRSLDSEKAKALTKDKVLAPGTGAETKMGLFLRDTRLDELPQLLNVMLGDMNICGPRPVRKEIMEQYAAQIPNYKERFNVKPGLIGPTQAMMYHGTSKAIRSRLNNRLCRTEVSYRKELALVFTVAACVFMRSVTKTAEVAMRAIFPNRPSAAERTAERYDVFFESKDGRKLAVQAIDKTTLQLAGRADVGAEREGRLVLTLPDGRIRSFDVALKNGTDGFSYEPTSDLGIHMMSRYLFQQVVVPHHSEFIFAPLISRLSRRQ